MEFGLLLRGHERVCETRLTQQQSKSALGGAWAMPPAGIVGLGAYVPPKVMTNEDWAELVETSDEWIFTKTGMKERRIAADCLLYTSPSPRD